MTPAPRAIDLFLQHPTGVNRVDWLANQLLALAADCQYLRLRLVPDATGDGWVFEASDPCQVLSSRDPGPLRLFRTVLARLAKMAEEENGVPFSPYGGTLSFDRPGPDGSVQVGVEFGNTAGRPFLNLGKAPIAGRSGVDPSTE